MRYHATGKLALQMLRLGGFVAHLEARSLDGDICWVAVVAWVDDGVFFRVLSRSASDRGDKVLRRLTGAVDVDAASGHWILKTHGH